MIAHRWRPASAFLLAFGLLAGSPSHAHEYWLSPSAWQAGPGETIVLGALTGEGFVGERKLYSPERTVRLIVRAGRELDLTRVASARDSTWARFRTDDRSGALFAYESNFATITLDGPKFDRYLADDGLDAPLAARRRLADPGPGRERYRRCAKAWVSGGAGGDDQGRALRPLGMPFEIVPLAVPGAGSSLRVRALFEGRPAPGVLVHAWRQPLGAGGSPLDPARRDTAAVAWSGRSDRHGEVRVPVAEAGEWLVSAVHMIPSRDTTAADWESTWASLTFARSAAAAR